MMDEFIHWSKPHPSLVKKFDEMLSWMIQYLDEKSTWRVIVPTTLYVYNLPKNYKE